MNPYIQIHPDDTVAVALTDLEKDHSITQTDQPFSLPAPIRQGHKFALTDITSGSPVIKYGSIIGTATAPIQPGEWVHSHNIKTTLDDIVEYSYQPESPTGKKQTNSHTFQGYLRKNASVGIRNEIWIINTVGCINKTAEILAKEANIKFAGLTDGIFTFAHPHGCSQLGDDHRNTQKILAGLAHHPNAGGVLVLGLGCENNHIKEFKSVLGNYDTDRVKFLSAQDVDNEIQAGLDLLEELVTAMKMDQREPVPASELVIGLKCGGSDGLSGITANPLVGALSDLIIDTGGASVLTEVPEMFGAEKALFNRAQNKQVFDKSVHLINQFKDYFKRHGQVIYENPSPGNKEGGITTLEEKSLGCTQKGGNRQIVDVLHCGDQVSKKGLHLLDGPGNDMVAITNLTAAGAHLILFTTGRGTALGAPVPTIKIASNSPMFNKKAHWIDFNAGRLLEGEAMEDLSQELLRDSLDIASGEKTCNEINGYREIALFKTGITL